MSKRTPKNHKKSHNTRVVLCWHEKKLKVRRGNRYCFVPQGGTFPTETIRLVVREALVCEKLIHTPAQNGIIFSTRHVGIVPWYHVMFHEFQTIFRFTRSIYLNVSGRATVSTCLTIILISCMWPKLATKDKHFIFLTRFYGLEHVSVVQFWIMHINA